MAEKQTKQKLTKRQKAFVEQMANPSVKSQTEAALKAGYSPKVARLVGSQNITKYNISDAIQRRINRAMNHHKVTPEEVLGSAVFNMRASMDDLMDEQGFFDLAKARETGAIDLIKEIEFDQKIDLETGTKNIRHKVKFESPAAARKEVANYIGLENFGNNAGDLTDEQLAAELFKRLIAKGYAEEKILEKLESEFPTIDVKLITNGA